MEGVQMDYGQNSKAGQVAIIIIVLAVVILAFMFYFKSQKGVESTLELLNLKDSADEKATETARQKNVDTAQKANYWTSKYYKQTGYVPSPILSPFLARDLSRQIYDAVGHITDTPAQAVGAIKQLKTKAQLSMLVDIFFGIYNRDLLSFLNEHFDTLTQKKALNEILNYAAALPAGLSPIKK